MQGQAALIAVIDVVRVCLVHNRLHWRRKDFFQGGALCDISKIFPEGAKSGEICFSHSKLRKEPFFAEIFKIQSGANLFLLKSSKSKGPLPPSDAHDRLLFLHS